MSCGSGFGEERSIEWVGVTDMLEGGARDTGINRLCGNWNFKTLNSKCKLIEVCLVVTLSLVGSMGGAFWRSSSEIGKGIEWVSTESDSGLWYTYSNPRMLSVSGTPESVSVHQGALSLSSSLADLSTFRRKAVLNLQFLTFVNTFVRT